MGMKRVVSVKTMREMDEATIASGVSAEALMRRAGQAILASWDWQNGVCILCGSGNNGGDGYVLASLLAERGILCRVLTLGEPRSEEARACRAECLARGISVREAGEDEDFSEDSAIVDCLFGTGFRPNAEGRAAELIRAVNRSGRPVISVDVNSGMNGNNGLGEPCICSDLTVAVGELKSGHFLGNAKDRIGELKRVDIGISADGFPAAWLLEKEDLLPILGTRLQNSHKGTYGYVAILGGCREYAGAVKLANLSCAALRSGCGVATLAVPCGLTAAVAPYLLESTLYPLSEDKNGCANPSEEELERLLKGKRAIAVGMGWGRSEGYRAILSQILQADCAKVIDADGLNALAHLPQSLLREARGGVVLTPHPKELERLSGVSVEEILRDPVGVAEKFARESGIILLLKGPTTVITNGQETYLVDRGCAGMATAGSGDVLSGVLAGLLGYVEVTPRAVACGAWIAGRAGELAAQAVNPVSMLASDTVAHLAEAIGEILHSST